MSGEPVFFGVRHLSPAGAFHLRRLLDDVRPQIVLVEAPADLEPLLPDIARPGTQPPIAILAYTREPPVRSLLYPLAEYSPEYQAILWAREHGVPCRFMDLPSDVFLALSTGDGIEEEPEGDAEVIAVGARALRWQLVTLPLGAWVILCNMMLQTIRRPARAVTLASSRQGLFFIPFILILPHFFGLGGVVVSQAAADLCSFLLALPLTIPVLNSFKKRPGSVPQGR